MMKAFIILMFVAVTLIVSAKTIYTTFDAVAERNEALNDVQSFIVMGGK